MPTKSKEAFKRWYEQNKEKLAARRKERYYSDPEYRRKAIENSRSFRSTRSRRVQPLGGYVVSLPAMLETLDITVWQFREWRVKNYFPEPSKFGREIWFTENQRSLLAVLTNFLSGRRRLSKSEKEELAGLVSMIYANWND